MKRKALLIVLLIFSAFPVFAAGVSIDKQLDGIYGKAEAAVAKRDYKNADFWIARYLGLSEVDEKTKKGFKDMIPLFDKMQDRLKATAFISGRFHESFLEFFFRGNRTMWAVPDNNIKEGNVFLVRSNIDQQGKYVC